MDNNGGTSQESVGRNAGTSPASGGEAASSASPKKRRKVNHGKKHSFCGARMKC